MEDQNCKENTGEQVFLLKYGGKKYISTVQQELPVGQTDDVNGSGHKRRAWSNDQCHMFFQKLAATPLRKVRP